MVKVLELGCDPVETIRKFVIILIFMLLLRLVIIIIIFVMPVVLTESEVRQQGDAEKNGQGPHAWSPSF